MADLKPIFSQRKILGYLEFSSQWLKLKNFRWLQEKKTDGKIIVLDELQVHTDRILIQKVITKVYKLWKTEKTRQIIFYFENFIEEK